ncbi:hypothetical protein IWZ03DRAFT_436551 [Phyllosticta citriasiana]|uniref:Uncharacterized protein n=1 Tax=Phyllosticta citriasiana TaxID=595635 RepID=A0ABR1KB46_9PEZI
MPLAPLTRGNGQCCAQNRSMKYVQCLKDRRPGTLTCSTHKNLEGFIRSLLYETSSKFAIKVIHKRTQWMAPARFEGDPIGPEWDEQSDSSYSEESEDEEEEAVFSDQDDDDNNNSNRIPRVRFTANRDAMSSSKHRRYQRMRNLIRARASSSSNEYTMSGALPASPPPTPDSLRRLRDAIVHAASPPSPRPVSTVFAASPKPPASPTLTSQPLPVSPPPTMTSLRRLRDAIVHPATSPSSSPVTSVFAASPKSPASLDSSVLRLAEGQPLPVSPDSVAPLPMSPPPTMTSLRRLRDAIVHPATSASSSPVTSVFAASPKAPVSPDSSVLRLSESQPLPVSPADSMAPPPPSSSSSKQQPLARDTLVTKGPLWRSLREISATPASDSA